ncbi:DUF2380 domain-containing protein [Jiella sp. M17.18]|uniref:DUF2380 domain-containing protein n=1 Tax=Jiella sp. M17.18 TaxID=3234247 RepID=UPI0034DEE7E2
MSIFDRQAGHAWRALAFAVPMAMLAAPTVAAKEPARLAVLAFDYSDTSGEVRDQSADHTRRLAEFRKGLRDRLTAGSAFRAVELPCVETEHCSAGNTPPAELLKRARAAGVDYLVFGKIHKMSTLVGWGRVEVLDVSDDHLVSDHVISFRGDTDEAYERAATFTARDILRGFGPGDTAAKPAAAAPAR